MDKLDIFEMEDETRVVTTVRELRRLYVLGVADGSDEDENDDDVLVYGDIV